MNEIKCPKCKRDLKVLPSSGRYVCSCGWTSRKQQNLNNKDRTEKPKSQIGNSTQEKEQDKHILEEMKKLEKHIVLNESNNGQHIKKIEEIVREVKSHLDDNESITEILLFQPISWGRLFMETTEGITVATNKRVIVFTPGTVAGYNLESIDYSKISSINMKEGVMYNEIELSTSGNEIEIKNIIKGNTSNFIKYVRNQIAHFNLKEQKTDNKFSQERMFDLAIKEMIAIKKEMQELNQKTNFIINFIHDNNVNNNS